MKTINTKQRIVLLVLPLLVLPVILAFSWATQTMGSKDEIRPSGINTLLPEPQLEQKVQSKMELYQLEAREEKRRKELIRMDPYRQSELEETGMDFTTIQPELLEDPLEARESELMEKLGALEKQLSDPPKIAANECPEPFQPRVNPSGDGLSADVAMLESMMEKMQPSGPDPELEQLEGMLDKILDVQHPERIRDRIREKELAKPRYTVTSGSIAGTAPRASWGTKDITKAKNGFYGLEDEEPLESPVEMAIAAELAENTVLEGGGRMKIRLLEEVRVNGIRFPSGSLVYGQANLQGNRLDLQITSMRAGNKILPVELEAYDEDGMQGIPISSSLGREIQQGTGDALVSGMPTISSGLTLETQMASAGMSAAKGLFRKKNKAVKVTLKAGHPILLMNQKR
ncbi:conjugative transposon protein TraM [Echinicola sediminis]